MKRVGKRGSGEFERISWDEALDIIAEKWKYTLDTYGSEAFYNCATGTRNYPIQRLMNLTGGYLGTYNSESNGQIAQTANYLFGFDPVNFDCAGGLGSNTAAIKDADCGVFFGCGSGESRMCGMGEVYEVAKAREAGIPVVFIDYRLGERPRVTPTNGSPFTRAPMERWQAPSPTSSSAKESTTRNSWTNTPWDSMRTPCRRARPRTHRTWITSWARAMT